MPSRSVPIGDSAAPFRYDGDSTSPEGRTAAQLQAPTSATGIYADWSDLDLDGDGEASASPWDFGTATDYPALAVGANHAGGLAAQRGRLGPRLTGVT